MFFFREKLEMRFRYARPRKKNTQSNREKEGRKKKALLHFIDFWLRLCVYGFSYSPNNVELMIALDEPGFLPSPSLVL